MEKIKCASCGTENAVDAVCPYCGHAAVNGAARRRSVKPPPPPQLAGWVFTPTPPEMAEEIRRTFNEDEYLVAARELERTGGVSFEEIMTEIEQKLHGRN